MHLVSYSFRPVPLALCLEVALALDICATAVIPSVKELALQVAACAEALIGPGEQDGVCYAAGVRSPTISVKPSLEGFGLARAASATAFFVSKLHPGSHLSRTDLARLVPMAVASTLRSKLVKNCRASYLLLLRELHADLLHVAESSCNVRSRISIVSIWGGAPRWEQQHQLQHGRKWPECQLPGMSPVVHEGAALAVSGSWLLS